MEISTPKSCLVKRPNEGSKEERSQKRSCSVVEKRDCELISERVYNFRVLLPNGTSLDVKFRVPRVEMPVWEFIYRLKQQYFEEIQPSKRNREIEWTNEDLHLVDAYENKIRNKLDFGNFKPNICHILRLQDGSAEAGTYENMWDLTPDTDLLRELPEEYTFETALAELIDNSLQAVWFNDARQRRLISVKIEENRIEIFDTGPGMDGSPENSIVKWGKMGASSHRLVREQGIGSKPPYLKPFFGMFGYGGPFATMHLGRFALVSSKTQLSKKVYVLHLERESLLSSSAEQTWRTKGGLRDPKKSEVEKAPHGSFTKVEIFEPKLEGVNVTQLRCRLKDIYFPYIQCDELSMTGKTVMPIKFQVNGKDLMEILSGEVAVTNINSCNGREFTLQLHFSKGSSCQISSIPGCRASQEANARLRCVYFPIKKGKESIEKILEMLKEDGCGISENFNGFSRVSVRRLGRLLPEARWAWLPFMEPKQKRGVKAQIYKRCCYRVKCFIDTDAGFNPTQSKTDLAHQNPYTIALKNFGKMHLDKDKDVCIKVFKDGRELSLSKLDKLYEDWIFDMHTSYDEEMDTGNDEPTFIVGPSNKEELGISSDVIRVHELFWRKDIFWRSGQKIKILKGACVGLYRTDVYATLEYIILEGCQGDAGCEARLICRPIDIPEESGCILTTDKCGPTIRIGSSISVPVSVIDSRKCIAIDDAVWENQIQKRFSKQPSSIELLGAEDCHELGIGGALLLDVIDAGCEPPEEIVAVVRPISFKSSTESSNLDRKHIVQEKFQMVVEVNFRAENVGAKEVKVFSGLITPSSQNGVQGFYVFQLRKEQPTLFEKAGLYTFAFFLKESTKIYLKKRVQVKAIQVKCWRLLGDTQNSNFTVRVGSCVPPFSVACFDKYDNRVRFPSDTTVMVKLSSDKGVSAYLSNMKEVMSLDKLTITIKDLLVVSSELDNIRPSYNCTLFIVPPDDMFSLDIPCQVMPGTPRRVLFDKPKFVNQLVPGEIIKDLVLEVLDNYGNHVKENESICLKLDGLCIQGKKDLTFKANPSGCFDLCGLLKVVPGYGKRVSFSVMSYAQMIFKEEFQVESRELHAAFEMPILLTAGSQLEDLVFEIKKTDGEVDEGFHFEEKNSQHHTLIITSNSLDLGDPLEYSFHFGRCTVQQIPVPQKVGKFCFKASHSHHPELHLNVEVHLLQCVHIEHENISEISEGRILPCQESFKLHMKQFMILPELATPSDAGNSSKCVTSDHMDELCSYSSLQVLEEELAQCGLRIKRHEMNVESLCLQKMKIKQDISNLQASLDLDCSQDFECTSEQESVVEQIVSKGDSAAAVICQLFQSSMSKDKENDFANNIIGVVAFLGSVQSIDLSRIFAQYLGEHQMLGIVCKSYAEASHLEKHESDGRVDNAYGLHALAAELETSIEKQYLVFCLENIRPYTGKFCSDPQRKLALQNPILANGNPPPGFLGYAVNMINIDVKFQRWRTASGHGLRETLFYRLFGELQVYENRQFMRQASSFIEDGAVSLDGGIIRGNGVISLGYWDADILFPVVQLQSQMHVSPRTEEITKQIESKKQELRETTDHITTENKGLEEVMEQFRKKEVIMKSRLKEMERSPGLLCKIKTESRRR